MNQPKEKPALAPPSGALRTTPFALDSWLRLDVFILLGIFTVFYYFKLSTFSISIDDEMAAIRDNANVWLLQGRWGVYLLERLFVNEQVVPFFPFFVFGCCLSISYPVLLSAFGVKRLQLVHYAAFPLYVAFPIWIFALSFFSNTIAFGVGQLLAVCALHCLRPLLMGAPWAVLRHPSLRSIGRMLCAAALAAVATGMYQSLLLSVAVLGLAMILIMALDEGVDWRPAFARCTILLLTLIAALILYALVELVFLRALNLGSERYMGTLVNLPVLLHDPLHVLALAGLNLARVYGGGSQVFGVTAWAFPLIVCCGIAALAGWPGVAARRRALLLLAAAAILTAPFILHVTAGGDFPPRTLVSVPAVMWFFAMLGMTSPRRWLAKLSLAAVAVAALQILYVVNLLQTANEFARKHDEALAAAIYTRIVSIDPHPSTVDFYGAQPFDSVYPRPLAATEGYSFFEWGGGNIYRIVAYLRLLGYPQLQIPTPEQRQRNDDAFKDMPTWPSPDAVHAANGMILVKLGPEPGSR
jgi:hypothetical protein